MMTFYNCEIIRDSIHFDDGVMGRLTNDDDNDTSENHIHNENVTSYDG